MTAYLIVYGENPTDRLAAYSFADRGSAAGASLPGAGLVPGVPPGSHAGGCAYVIEAEADVTFTGKLLLDVFNGLTEAGVKRFETRDVGVRRLLTVLPEVAKEVKLDNDAQVQEREPTADAGDESPKAGGKVKKAKAAKTPAEPRTAVPKSPMTRKEAADLAATAPTPDEGMKSGAYIRKLIQTPHPDRPGTSQFNSREISALTKHHFKDSKAGASDVSWNRGWLKKQGTTALELRRD